MIHESGRGFTTEQFNASRDKIMELFFEDEWKNISGNIRDYIGPGLAEFNTGQSDGKIEAYLAHNGFPASGVISCFSGLDRDEYEQLRAELMEREGVTIPDYLGLEES